MEIGSDVAANVAAVRRRMAAAAARAGRDVRDVRLVAAAKTMPAARVRAAIDAGIEDVGQNYVQEALRVREAIDAPVRWHMIGHLQRNKAARAAVAFDVVQTVDSVALGRALARRATAAGRTISIMVEVNLAAEESKHGVAPVALAALADELRGEDGLRVEGLMCIPPAASGEETRPYFRRLRELGDATGLRELSMGMTGDFEVAIEEGATIVRIGTAIFGPRAGRAAVSGPAKVR